MKRSKKIISMMLASAMVLSLAACGNKTQNTGNNNTSPTTGAEVSVTPEPTDVVDRYPAINMGGRVIKISAWFDRFYDSNHQSIDANPNLTNVETAQLQLDNLRRLEEKYNMRLESFNVGWEKMKESINTSISAGAPEYDVYTIDLQFGIPAIANGLALPINEYIPATSDLATDNIAMKSLETFGNTYLWAPNTLSSGGIFMAYNVDIVSALGVEDPQALYEKGEWTWDKFAEYAKLATKDLNGDSVPDQYGYAGIPGTNYAWVYANNAQFANEGKEMLTSKEFIEAYTHIDRLYNVDKSAKWFSETQDPNTENLYAWAKGNIAFWGTRAWQLDAGKKNHGADFEYRVVPYPKGPSGDGSYTTPVGGQWYMLPKGVNKPSEVYQVMEEYFNWFNFDTSYIYNTDSFEQYFWNDKDMQIALETGKPEKMVLDTVFHVGFNLGDLELPIVKGDATVSQAIETYKQVLQDKLDFIFVK